jgi:hypothetical protein
MNSELQSLHFKTLSWYSIGGSAAWLGQDGEGMYTRFDERGRNLGGGFNSR